MRVAADVLYNKDTFSVTLDVTLLGLPPHRELVVMFFGVIHRNDVVTTLVHKNKKGLTLLGPNAKKPAEAGLG